MPSFWAKTYNIFSNIFARDLSRELPSPESISGAGLGRADAIGTSEYLEGGATYNHSVEIQDLNDFLEVGEHTDRRARYLEYDRLENVPEITIALDTYANETTAPDINGKAFVIKTSNQEVKEELEWLFFSLLDIDTEILWSIVRNTVKNGDCFIELIIDTDHPELGVQKINELPAESMYRIETIKGTLIEFQQAYLGPDYKVILDDLNANKQTQSEAGFPAFSPRLATTGIDSSMVLSNNKIMNQVIRFRPEQIIHLRIGPKRRGFYPYGVSILYAGRRVAHLLKLMEDSMVIYRLTRAPERKVFYIDVGQLQGNKAENVVQRVRDKIKKKKVYNPNTNSIDERYNPWAVDEDFFMAVRPESNSRIESLPGGQCLDLDTKIKLIDGTSETLSNIIEKYKNGEINWVYSCNPENGKIIPGKITWAGITRLNTQVMKITFDNNKYLVCTPDHKLICRDGSGYKEAKDFQIGDSLMPFNEKIEDEKYLIYDNNSKNWVSVKELIDSYIREVNLKLIKKLKSNGETFNIHNHTITKIEYLEEKIDTGTLTIEGFEEIHGFHNFALECGIFVKNSMGEIDDTKYFREKLFLALSLPRNFLMTDDISINRSSLTTQDMRFARSIWRIQKVIQRGLRQIAVEHLRLKGFPEELYRNLDIIFTQPSDWIELSRAEILNSRYSLAGSIKSSQLYDDHTILTKILNHSDQEATAILEKLEKQLLRQQEIQAQAQVFAQITQAEIDKQQQQMQLEPQEQLGEETPQIGSEQPQLSQEQPGQLEQPGISPETETPQTQISPKEKQEEEIPEEEIKDFSDLEADEEEIEGE